jgi:group I intron endonuclease
MFGRVYLVRNKLNGKLYVGITTLTLRARWIAHVGNARSGRRKWMLHRAVAKYGAENFEILLLENCPDRDALQEAERRWIETKRSFQPSGYNMTLGGGGVSGFKRSDEFKLWVSQKFRGRSFSEETRRKMSAAKAGQKLSPQCYEASRAYSTGRPKSPETREKIGAAHRGKKLSPEHIEFLRNFKTGTKLTAKGRIAISRPVMVNGTKFSSIGAASAELKVRISTISKRIEAGLNGYESLVPIRRRAKRTPEQCEAASRRARKRVTVDGITYESLTAAGSALGVTRQAIRWRITVGARGQYVPDDQSAADR